MKKIQKLLLTLICITSFGIINPAIAKWPSFDVNSKDIQSFVDYLLCEFDVQITPNQVHYFLDKFTIGDGLDCLPLDVVNSESTTKTESFTWSPSPDANRYTVGSLGLTDGSHTKQITKKKGHKFDNLNPQQYLFIFIADCLDGSSAANIIIVDKDVHFTFNMNSSLRDCDCSAKRIPAENDCSFNDVNSYTFPWKHLDLPNCDIGKYSIYVSGHDYSSTFWVLHHNLDSPQKAMFLTCSDHFIDGYGMEDRIADPGNFEVILTTIGIHIYMPNRALIAKGGLCDCNSESSLRGNNHRLQQVNPIQSLVVSPNPFSENINITFPGQKETLGKLSIVSTNGQIILKEDIQISDNNNSINYNTSSLPPGVYSIFLETEQQKYIERIVKL